MESEKMRNRYNLIERIMICRNFDKDRKRSRRNPNRYYKDKSMKLQLERMKKYHNKFVSKVRILEFLKN